MVSALSLFFALDASLSRRETHWKFIWNDINDVLYDINDQICIQLTVSPCDTHPTKSHSKLFLKVGSSAVYDSMSLWHTLSSIGSARSGQSREWVNIAARILQRQLPTDEYLRLSRTDIITSFCLGLTLKTLKECFGHVTCCHGYATCCFGHVTCCFGHVPWTETPMHKLFEVIWSIWISIEQY